VCDATNSSSTATAGSANLPTCDLRLEEANSPTRDFRAAKANLLILFAKMRTQQPSFIWSDMTLNARVTAAMNSRQLANSQFPRSGSQPADFVCKK
jgi:hypothetical protein